MALKTKIRTIRFSQEMEDLINQQVGESFTAKFDRLVYNCYMLAPQKEKEVQELDKQIARKKELLRALDINYKQLSHTAVNLVSKFQLIQDSLAKLDALSDLNFGSDDSDEICDPSLRL